MNSNKISGILYLICSNLWASVVGMNIASEKYGFALLNLSLVILNGYISVSYLSGSSENAERGEKEESQTKEG